MRTVVRPPATRAAPPEEAESHRGRGRLGCRVAPEHEMANLILPACLMAGFLIAGASLRRHAGRGVVMTAATLAARHLR